MDHTHRSSGLPLNLSQITSAELTTLKPVLENIQKRLDDWAQLHYYKHANEKLIKEKSNEKQVVFLGDSITEFWLKPENGGFFPGKHYINRGISFQTTPQMLLRLRADVIALKPHVLIFLGGTNDIAGNTGPMTFGQTTDNIASIAELTSLHNIKLIIASLLPTSDYHFDRNDQRTPMPQTKRRPLEKIKALNSWIERYCKEQNHIYLDYWNAMVDASGKLNATLSNDDLHPNAAGYAIMAPLAQKAIAHAIEL